MATIINNRDMSASVDEDMVDLTSYGWLVSPLATATALSSDESEQFDPAAHLKVVSDAIVDAFNGQGKRFIVVSMPPGHGKSWLISRRTPEWFLANYPSGRVGVVGYGDEFATNWGRLVRNDLKRHADRFGFDVSEDSRAANWWHTSQGGMMWAAGINGQITGKRAHLMIIDDPVKNMLEANSPTYRDHVWEQYTSAARTRLFAGGVVIVVMTRWHTDDLAGRLTTGFSDTDASLWREIRLPAIWQHDEPDLLGRKNGDPLWPGMFPASELDILKRGMDQQTWDALFQQEPINSRGQGLIYYAFNEDEHVQFVERNTESPLIWTMDFNVDPMSSVIAQTKEWFAPNAHLTNEKIVNVEVLDEIVLPNSNTQEACEEFHARVQLMQRGRRCEVHVYGDVAGNHRDTRSNKTDWQIVREFFSRNNSLYNAKVLVGSSAPPVRDRINSMNGAFKSAFGEKRMFIHPKCKELIKDFKGIVWKRDASGNTTNQPDKSDHARTHTSDALGYYIFAKMGIRSKAGEMPGSPPR